MFERIIGGSKAIEKALDASWQRNDIIAQNISNVDTPNYKRNTVHFEEYLSQAIDGRGIRGRRTHARHIPVGRQNIDSVDIKVTKDNSSLSMRLDGNNVDIDNEMADMAKNSIKYNVLIQRLSSSYRRMKSVIGEGRR